MTEVRSMDLTGARPPALSTTSDMPVVGEKTEPAPKGAVSEEEIAAGGTEQAKAAAKAKADKAGKGADPIAEERAAAEKEAAEKKVADEAAKSAKRDETPPEIKREITKARNRERAAEARAEVLEVRLDKALTALEKAATRTGTEVKTEEGDPRPKRPVKASFDDPDKYDAAIDSYESDLVAWSAKAAAKLTQAENERAQKEREASDAKTKSEGEVRARQQERADAWKTAREDAIEKYPDFAEVAESDKLPITLAMGLAIQEENLESGKGFEILYYLGQHPEEAAKIAALPSNERQGLAIGRLAERLAATPVKVTKAPDPPKPIGARARAAEKSANEESMEEYAARRKTELRAQRANPH